MWYLKIKDWKIIECENIEMANKLYLIFKKNERDDITLIHKTK